MSKDNDMSVVKKIYDKYNNYSERVTDIICQTMEEENITVEEMTEILKTEPKLLAIYKTECESFKLLKEEKTNSFDLTDVFD